MCFVCLLFGFSSIRIHVMSVCERERGNLISFVVVVYSNEH